MKIIISLILVLVIIIVLTFFKRTKAYISKKRDTISIFVALITTFLGAMLAIYLTREDIISKEKCDIIKILEISTIEIKHARKELNAYSSYENNSIVYLMFIKDNMPKNIEITNQVSKSELFLKYVSKNTFSNLNIGFFTIQSINEWINEPNISADECKILIEQDKRTYDFIEEVIESERKLICDEITEKELIKIQNECLKKLFNVKATTNDINEKYIYRYFRTRNNYNR